MIFPLISALLLGYLLGCIPFALLIGFTKGMDIRTKGSKNIGSTNLLRLAGKGPGFAALFGDAGKGWAAVIITGLVVARLVEPQMPGADAGNLATILLITAGVGAILGHSFNIFLRFTGGKAVAVSVGIFLALAPLHLLLSFAAFVVIVSATRYISLGSMLGSVVMVVALFVWPVRGSYIVSYLGLVTAALICVKHHTNVRRLLKGEENKFSLRRKK